MNKELEKINNEQLQLIPKVQEYIQYMLETLIKLPRIEKFSIGNEYKCSMYKLLEYILYVSKIEKEQRLEYINGYIINNRNEKEYINKIDAELNCQRIYLRIMYKNKWINDKKFNVSITKVGEIGKIVGGLIKYYVKNNKE